MKPYYYPSYREEIHPWLKSPLAVKSLFLTTFFKYYLVIIPVLLGTLLFFKFNSLFMTICLFSIALISMFPLLYAPWLGILDMNVVLTAYATINYGIPAGLFVGTASVVGLIFVGDAENVLFDGAISYLIVFISSMFVMQAFIPAVITCGIVYFICSITFHYFFGSLDVLNIMWNMTHLAWVLFLALQIVPLIM